MCGRYASTSSRRDLLFAFEATEAVGEELPPSYNIAPTSR
ncbi:SOS response-associated peptidase [Rhodococcus sp. UNC363MFTsu5.1]|nr:SOS response-associated peptidase [Rhodococcus sp. UNC363MFTsu5.1]